MSLSKATGITACGVKMRFWFIAVAIHATTWLGLGLRRDRSTRGSAIQNKEGTSSQDGTSHADDSRPDRTKAAARDSKSTHYTHSPERLREFMLPAVMVDGLSLDAALRKLMATYKDACQKSGETPLPLNFAIPPGAVRKLTVQLPAGNFKTSVQLLAALSGMKVSRKDLEYRFEAIENERKSVNRDLQVSPDFQDALRKMAGFTSESAEAANAPESIEECLAKLGQIDPSTRVSLEASGHLKLETMHTADAAMIENLAKSFDNLPPTHLQSETKIVELPADSQWTPPDVSQMTNGEIEKLLQDFSRQKGTEVMTLPGVTSRNGQAATIALSPNVFYPSNEPGKEPERSNVGKVLALEGNFLGFGHDVDVRFSDTSIGMDPSTGKATLDKRTEMTDRTYSSDGGTKLVVQTRPDGSRTVLVFKSATSDASGRPIH